VEGMLTSVGNYGFPMVMAFYLLIRIEKKLEALTGAITGLQMALGASARVKVPGETYPAAVPVGEGQ
jgi:hypothetical protein